MEQKASAGDLYTTFFKIGLCTFGGGYAMIPLITNTCVEYKGWISAEEMGDITVIAESTPGPMAVNCATYVGWKQAGLAGALAGTLGIVTPSFLIIYLISLFFDHLLSIAVLSNAFRGVQAAVAILILDAAFSLLWRMEKKALPVAVFFGTAILLLAAALRSIRISTVTLLLAAAALSLGIYGARGAFAEEEAEAPREAEAPGEAGAAGKGKSDGAAPAKAKAKESRPAARKPAEELDPKAAKEAAKRAAADAKAAKREAQKVAKGAKKAAKAAKKDAKAEKKAAKKGAKAEKKAAKKADKGGKKKGGKGK